MPGNSFHLGNRFWELRSKHGRERLFTSAEDMWAAACEYFTWCEDNPLIAIEYNGKDAVMCEVPKMRAFTIQGLTSYLDCNVGYFLDFKKSLDKDERDFSGVIARIEEVIYNQKFTGAAAGFLNANIIARDLKLRDNTDVTTGGDKLPPATVVNLPTAALSEIEKILSNVASDSAPNQQS